MLAPVAYANTPPTATELSALSDGPLGKISSVYIESDSQLSLEQAFQHYQQGDFKGSLSEVLTFGIGAAPVWIGLSVQNVQLTQQQRFLSIDTSWLDRVDVYVKNRTSDKYTEYHVGDHFPFNERPRPTREFQLAINLDPGITDILLHVRTADSMVLPIYLLNKQQQQAHDSFTQYSYGLIYGYLLALLLYNGILFIGLRDIRYLLYSALLGSFMLGNIAYTGHGFMWFWPNNVDFQLWCQPMVMILFATIGLLFAVSFLEIQKKSKPLFQTVIGLIAVVNIGYILTLFANLPTAATILSFGFTSSYMLIATVLGIYAMIKKQHNAFYYVIAITFGSTGVAIAALASWGVLPYNEWLFRAAEIGMLIEATLLAQTLSNQFKNVQKQNEFIERLADTDLLTQLNNRRGFFKLSTPIWNNSLRHQRQASLIIFDLDDFKKINDIYGHDCGDIILKKLGALIHNQIRNSDVAARWGGEEFVILLAETPLEHAIQLAERLRLDIASTTITYKHKEIKLTASFGIAEQHTHHISIENLISEADAVLYHAKTTGKNRVCTFIDLVEQTSANHQIRN